MKHKQFKLVQNKAFIAFIHQNSCIHKDITPTQLFLHHPRLQDCIVLQLWQFIDQYYYYNRTTQPQYTLLCRAQPIIGSIGIGLKNLRCYRIDINFETLIGTCICMVDISIR